MEGWIFKNGASRDGDGICWPAGRPAGRPLAAAVNSAYKDLKEVHKESQSSFRIEFCI